MIGPRGPVLCPPQDERRSIGGGAKFRDTFASSAGGPLPTVEQELAATTSDTTNGDIVRDVYAHFGRGDVAGLLALLHQDVVWIWNGPAAIPYAGVRQGHRGAGEFLRIVGETLTIEQFAPRHFVADGETVAVLGEERVRVRTTGRVFAAAWVHVWTVRTGRVKELRCFADTTTIASAFQT